MTQRPLHEQDPLGRFEDRARAYARFRPDYPKAVVPPILDGPGEPGSLVIADVGAGTGISSRLLADAGPRVIAIEPSAAMRGKAAPHPRVEWRAGTAERTGLDAGSVAAVAAFQAFHWFEPDATLAEWHRVLRPGGRVALVWNRRDPSDPFTAAYGACIAGFASIPPAEDRDDLAAPLHGSPLFRDARTLRFAHAQPLDREGIAGRALSTSYLPQEGEAAARMLDALCELHRRFAGSDGIAALRYVTVLHLAERI